MWLRANANLTCWTCFAYYHTYNTYLCNVNVWTCIIILCVQVHVCAYICVCVCVSVYVYKDLTHKKKTACMHTVMESHRLTTKQKGKRHASWVEEQSISTNDKPQISGNKLIAARELLQREPLENTLAHTCVHHLSNWDNSHRCFFFLLLLLRELIYRW